MTKEKALNDYREMVEGDLNINWAHSPKTVTRIMGLIASDIKEHFNNCTGTIAAANTIVEKYNKMYCTNN